MIVRTAVLEGIVAAEKRAGFDRHMRETVLTAIGRYPGIKRVTLRSPAEREPDTPPIYMMFDLYFDSLDAMHAALASPVRAQVRALIAEGMSSFEGRVYHLVTAEVSGGGVGS
ncbi:MAG: EthD family reductase [Gammaproteobacteria bacterium]|nr:EthD family reductase [Gammaproteobacteria bacterium]